MRVLTIAFKDFYQFLKKWQTFVFMLIMPPIFIMMFGGMFSAGKTQTPLLLVSGVDNSVIADGLINTLKSEQSIDVQVVDVNKDEMLDEISSRQAAAGVIINTGLDTDILLNNDWSAIHWISGANVLQEINVKNIFDREMKKVNAAAQFARADMDLEENNSLSAFEKAFDRYYQQLTNQKVQLSVIQTEKDTNPYSHPAPGMMLQFAIAGLTGVAAILVMEKNGLTEARLRMSAVPAWQVMLGHYLAICMLLGSQFFLLLAFGQIALGLDYLSSWLSTSLLSLATILCVAAMGLLIGVVSKSEDETVVYAMLAMFVLSGLGGLWMPLETTGKAFQTIGHLTPLAWAMDGYRNILDGSYSFSSISGSLLVLSAYTVGLLVLTIGIFQHQKSRTR